MRDTQQIADEINSVIVEMASLPDLPLDVIKQIPKASIAEKSRLVFHTSIKEHSGRLSYLSHELREGLQGNPSEYSFFKTLADGIAERVKNTQEIVNQLNSEINDITINSEEKSKAYTLSLLSGVKSSDDAIDINQAMIATETNRKKHGHASTALTLLELQYSVYLGILNEISKKARRAAYHAMLPVFEQKLNDFVVEFSNLQGAAYAAYGCDSSDYAVLWNVNFNRSQLHQSIRDIKQKLEHIPISEEYFNSFTAETDEQLANSG
ncbi:hypothetical protein [Thiothrix winogradskyi]|uniref:Toxin n=1 Tax=Thiothrix winogradskyi TaxID=96472 RepID=A0ABY3SWN7_9GAMM|nr:hypothetical protein [Thiothrix winogradskyi]UJS23902.1 hypothetical protein L2Y54_18470 [Thiothrix winogradskyi]